MDYQSGTKLPHSKGWRPPRSCCDVINVAGAGNRAEVAGTRKAITDSYVPVGAHSFNLADASGLQVGDNVLVVRTPISRSTDGTSLVPNDHWMTTHPYGIEEREAKNNHGTCWVMQVAAFARLTGNQELMNYCRDAMAALCQILSSSERPEDNLWAFELADGRGMRRATAFMAPYIRDKKSWPLKPDVMYDQEWPMRHHSLLFAGLAFGNLEYINLWKTLKADSTVEEVIRNFFIRQPVLWVK